MANQREIDAAYNVAAFGIVKNHASLDPIQLGGSCLCTAAAVPRASAALRRGRCAGDEHKNKPSFFGAVIVHVRVRGAGDLIRSCFSSQ
jgi:hypothetical protein